MKRPFTIPGQVRMTQFRHYHWQARTGSLDELARFLTATVQRVTAQEAPVRATRLTGSRGRIIHHTAGKFLRCA